MARADEFNKSFEKPADRYIEWASDDQQFKYWDGEIGEEILIPIPLKFVVLMVRHTVRGFHDDSNSRIYSNEVEDLSSEVLTVKSFEGGVIAKGTYSSIKEAIENAGGHYAKSIYVLMLDGEIWNINLKGSAVFAWGEFVKKDQKLLETHSVSVTDFEQLKKGKIDYSIPVFEFGKTPMSSAGIKKADEAYDLLVEKLSSRAKSMAAKDDTPEEEEKPKKETAAPKKNAARPAVKKGSESKEETEEEETHDDDFPAAGAMPEEAEVNF